MHDRLLPLVLLMTAAATPTASFADDAAPADAEKSPRELCDARANQVLDALDEGNYEAAAAGFGADLRKRQSAADLKRDFESANRYGPTLARGRPHTGRIDSDIVVLTPLMLAHATYTIELRCNADGSEITDFRLKATQILSDP